MAHTYTLAQKLFMYDSYVITNSCGYVRTLFATEFPGVPVPHRNTVRNLVIKFRETGSMLDKKRTVKRRVLTEDKLDELGKKLKHTPQKSLRRLAQETGISETTVWRATKVLKVKPYEVTVVQELLPHDNENLVNFSNWILENVNGEAKKRRPTKK